MNDTEKGREKLKKELDEFRQRVAELNGSPIHDRLAEEELLRSEERYRSLVELCPDMIALRNQGKYVYVNPAGIKMLGASGLGDLVGKSVFDIVHPDCREIIKDRNRQIEGGRAVPLLEEKYVRLDGTIVDVEVAAAPILFRGEPMVQVIARDITERKRAEEAVRKSEEEAKRLAQENAIMAEIGQIISSTLNIEEVYELFSEKVKSILPFDWIAVSLIDKEKNTFINRYVEGHSLPGRNQGEFFSIGGTFSEKVIQSRKGIAIGDKTEDEIVAEFPSLLVSIKAGFRSFLSVPLISRDQVIGILHFRSKKDRAYSEQDLKLAESIAHQIAGAIANAQLFVERKRTQEEKASLQEQLY